LRSTLRHKVESSNSTMEDQPCDLSVAVIRKWRYKKNSSHHHISTHPDNGIGRQKVAIPHKERNSP
jgi:hypothetical protein